MKKLLVIGLPNATGTVPNDWAAMLAAICVHLATKGITCMTVGIDRSFVDNARNQIIKVAQQKKADYVFFLDADTYIEPTGVWDMIEMDKDIISPPVADRKGGHLLNVFDEWMVKMTEVDKTKKVKAIGSACTLIKAKVYEALLKEYATPYEFQLATTETGGKMQISEDTGFCLRAEKMGFETWCAKGIKTSHLGDSIKYNYEG